MTEVAAELSPLECATEITVAWLSNPNTRASAEDVPVFLQTMFSAALKLGSNPDAEEAPEPAQSYAPAVTVRKSLASRDHLISLVDGKSYKTLKRHLSIHGLTPAQYRERYGLKSDYPMVAPAYAETRRALAKKIGLGRKLGQKPGQAQPAATAQPATTEQRAPDAKAAAKAKPASAPKGAAKAKPASAPKSAGAAKPARRKKLGVQFGANGSAPADQS